MTPTKAEQLAARTSPVHQPAHGWTDADADAARLALELECILTDRDTPMPLTSRWWESAHEALALHRKRLAEEQAALRELECPPDPETVDRALAQARRREPVVPYLYVYEYDSPFGLNREFYPSGWNGQKPTRTVPLYTTPQPALAQRREPLTDEQIRREKPVCADWVSFRAGVRCAERIHGVGK